MLKKLVLFDIDGTLLSVNKINRSVLVDALTEVYGTAGSAGTHNFAGKMDSTIFYEVLRNAGLSEGDIAAKFEMAKKTYIEMFRAHAKPSDVLLMEGIRELLEELSGHSDVMLALLTGNFEASGRHKLLLPEINHYFPFGALCRAAGSATLILHRLHQQRRAHHPLLLPRTLFQAARLTHRNHADERNRPERPHHRRGQPSQGGACRMPEKPGRKSHDRRSPP